MKILIVEDEDMIREGISDYLSDCGYETKPFRLQMVLRP